MLAVATVIIPGVTIDCKYLHLPWLLSTPKFKTKNLNTEIETVYLQKK